MIQATDLAQILYGGHFTRKKTRATQNFNMAAIFQDGRPMVSWNVIFCLKMVVNGQKDYRDNRVYVLSMKNVQIMLCILLKCSDYFNMAANFQDGHHRLSRNTSFA